MIDLSGRVALVTGGGSGIGRATALALAQAGAGVAVVELRPERTEQVVAEARQRGFDVEGITADVSRPQDVERAVQRVLARWNGLDILFSNAGISGHVPVAGMDEAEWDRMLEVNLDSMFFTVRAAIPALKRSRHGRIICTASHYGVIGKEGMAHYSAAKGGVNGLVRSLALELGEYGITANAVAPGPVRTAIAQRTPEQVRSWEEALPLRRIGEPEDVAGAVLFLASDLAAWLTGQVLQVNGGAYLQ